MADNQGEEVLTFVDEGGNYYQIPRATFEQLRVPDDQKAALEQALRGDDTSGFSKFSPLGTPLVAQPIKLTSASSIVGAFPKKLEW